VARRLRLFTALLDSNTDVIQKRQPYARGPRVQAMPGGALVEMIAASDGEVRRWARAAHPTASVVEVEESPTLAELYGWGHLWKRKPMALA
jgi:hypothetical protein